MKMLELIYFKYTLRRNNNVQKINNLPVISIFLSQTLYLFSSVKENPVDTFSLGNIHCESGEKYGIIQVLTRQLGNESMNYISIIKLEKLFFITTSDFTGSHIPDTILVKQLDNMSSYIDIVRTLLHKIHIYNPISEYILNFVSSQLSCIVIKFSKPLWMCLKIQTHMWYNNWVVNHVFHVVLITVHCPNEVICTFRFVYIVMISSKEIVNKCGTMIVKEYGMYFIIFLCVKISIYSILKYL